MGAFLWGHMTIEGNPGDWGVTVRGVATGWVSVFIPPKISPSKLLWGKNNGRTAIQQFYTPQKNLYPPPKQISGYASGHGVMPQDLDKEVPRPIMI